MFTFDGNTVSDLHKDAYGFRPEPAFWDRWNEASDEGKQRIWDCLIQALQFTMEQEAAQEIAAINAFEFEIATALDLGAPSRQDAVRWIVEAMGFDEYDLMYGGSYVCFTKGLPYRMAGMFEPVIKQIQMKEAA
jgi:hypothetical protein